MARIKQREVLLIAIKIIIVLIIPIALTLYTVKEHAVRSDVTEEIYLSWQLIVKNGTTPYGYTCSLLLFIIPMVAIGWWFLTHPGFKIQKRAFLWSL
jgi:hypothetical protein